MDAMHERHHPSVEPDPGHLGPLDRLATYVNHGREYRAEDPEGGERVWPRRPRTRSRWLRILVCRRPANGARRHMR